MKHYPKNELAKPRNFLRKWLSSYADTCPWFSLLFLLFYCPLSISHFSYPTTMAVKSTCPFYFVHGFHSVFAWPAAGCAFWMEDFLWWLISVLPPQRYQLLRSNLSIKNSHLNGNGFDSRSWSDYHDSDFPWFFFSMYGQGATFSSLKNTRRLFSVPLGSQFAMHSNSHRLRQSRCFCF
jgi:hypothetical protein